MSSVEKKRGYEKMGRRAERLAALYLLLKGYRILARNYRTKSGEIDIVARKRRVVIAVEVKQRLTLAAAHESPQGKPIIRTGCGATRYFLSEPRQACGACSILLMRFKRFELTCLFGFKRILSRL